MLWCSTFFMLWEGVRNVGYHYVRNQREFAKVRDTLIIGKKDLGNTAVLQWVKEDEIRYRGRMFDIKQQVEIGGGNIKLIGHFDEWDDQLFKSLVKLLNSERNKSSKQYSGNILWAFDAILPAGYDFVRAVFVTIEYDSSTPSFYISYKQRVLSPPPDSAV